LDISFSGMRLHYKTQPIFGGPLMVRSKFACVLAALAGILASLEYQAKPG